MESITVALAFFEDSLSRKSSLCALENQHLKQQSVIVDRDSSFVIMVVSIEVLSGFAAEAAGFAVVGGLELHST